MFQKAPPTLAAPPDACGLSASFSQFAKGGQNPYPRGRGAAPSARSSFSPLFAPYRNAASTTTAIPSPLSRQTSSASSTSSVFRFVSHPRLLGLRTRSRGLYKGCAQLRWSMYGLPHFFHIPHRPSALTLHRPSHHPPGINLLTLLECSRY